MKILSTLILISLLGLSIAKGAPIKDLASPDQVSRDRAATELRNTFSATPESKWASTVERIKKGQSKKAILELLGPKVRKEEGFGSGQSQSQAYRLDTEWILRCWFQNDGDILIDREILYRLEHVWIAPKNDFTGTWVVYFVNGQKSHEIQYRDGKYFGTFTAYRSEGTLAYVQNYSAEGADGDDTGYHPSGKISYRGKYRAGRQVGTWKWYDEAGKVTSVQEHPKE